MNYLQFVDAIQQYAENYEQTFVDNIPVFLRLTEKRIYNRVQPPSAKKYVSATLSANVSTITKPDDYLAADFLRLYDLNTLSTVRFLLHKDHSYLREAYQGVLTGVPSAYADTNETVLTVGPAPAANYGYELGYFAYPTSIVDTTDGRSWLGDNYEQAVLYGALREAAIFMKEEKDVIENFERLYQQGLDDVVVLGNVKNVTDRYRNGVKR